VSSLEAKNLLLMGGDFECLLQICHTSHDSVQVFWVVLDFIRIKRWKKRSL